LNRSQGNANQLVLRIFFIGSIFFLVYSAGLFLENLLFFAKAKSVPGTVIEVVPIPTDSSEHHVFCATKVVFREETTERRFEFISSESLYPPAYSEDERITVFYDPENPENARIGDFRNLVVMPTVLFLYGTFFFMIGFLLIRTRRKIMRQKKM